MAYRNFSRMARVKKSLFRYDFHEIHLQERPLKRFLPLLSMITGLFLLLGAVLLWVNRSGSSRNEIRLPESIAGIPMTNSIRGEQALSEIASMHSGAFSMKAGAIGVYGSARQAMLWVAGAKDVSGADQLLEAMRVKIARGGTPFSSVQEWQDDQRTIYELQGLGQQHFYFRSNRLLVWLAVDEKDAGQAIREILTFYPYQP